MLKNRTDILLLSENECDLINLAVNDNATGHHLLCARTDNYWQMRKTLNEAWVAVSSGTATPKQLQMIEYSKQCEDYFYWRDLPDKEKLFIEDNSD